MNNKVARIIEKIINAIDGKLPVDNITDARELLEHGELGEALSLIYTQLYEYDVKVSRSTFDQIKLAGDTMGLNRRGWEVLEIESTQESTSTESAEAGQPHLGIIQNRELDLDIPEKYLRECSNGASEMAIAESLIREGHGKVLSIRFLRQLFDLSLEEANQLYEDARERA